MKQMKMNPLLMETITGKLGNYVFYNRLGVPCVRRMFSRGSRSPFFTPSQKFGQARIRYLVSLYQAVKNTSVKEAWQRARKRPGQTGYNAFMSRNYAAFGKDEVIADYARVKLCEGDLRIPLELDVRVTGEREFTLSWNTEEDMIMGQREDRLRLLLMYDDGSFRVTAREELEVTRGDGRAVVTLTPDEGFPVHLYCFWVAANGLAFSPSRYFPLAWGEKDAQNVCI